MSPLWRLNLKWLRLGFSVGTSQGSWITLTLVWDWLNSIAIQWRQLGTHPTPSDRREILSSENSCAELGSSVPSWFRTEGETLNWRGLYSSSILFHTGFIATQKKHYWKNIDRRRIHIFPLMRMKRSGMGPHILKKLYSCTIHREHPDRLHHCLVWQLLGLLPQGTTEVTVYPNTSLVPSFLPSRIPIPGGMP